jgi:hypothetical protein
VETDQAVAQLEAHFAAQLSRAGWTRTAGTADDVVGWSAWQLPGEESWRGVLLVLAAFGGSERHLSIRIDRNQTREDGASYVALR